MVRSFFAKEVWVKALVGSIPIVSAQMWRNWYTRNVEGVVGFGPCGFDSHHLYSNKNDEGITLKNRIVAVLLSLALLFGGGAAMAPAANAVSKHDCTIGYRTHGSVSGPGGRHMTVERLSETCYHSYNLYERTFLRKKNGYAPTGKVYGQWKQSYFGSNNWLYKRAIVKTTYPFLAYKPFWYTT